MTQITLVFVLNGSVEMRDGTTQHFKDKQQTSLYYAPVELVAELRSKWKYYIPDDEAYRLLGVEFGHLIVDISGRGNKEHRLEPFKHDLKFSNVRWWVTGSWRDWIGVQQYSMFDPI
jgi:hypothetical protein